MRVDEVAEKQKHLPWYNEKRSEACQAQPLKDRSLAKTTWECARRGRCVSSPHSNLQERKHFQSEWWLVFSVYPSPLCLNIPVPCVSTLNGSRPVCFYLPHFCLHSLGFFLTQHSWKLIASAHLHDATICTFSRLHPCNAKILTSARAMNNNFQVLDVFVDLS